MSPEQSGVTSGKTGTATRVTEQSLRRSRTLDERGPTGPFSYFQFVSFDRRVEISAAGMPAASR